MKHFSAEEWIDFVNQVVSDSKRQEMEEHLGEDCKRCSKTVSVWQRVRRTAKSERNYQPPKDIIRIAEAAFAGSRLPEVQKRANSLVEMLFDSFLQPAVEGARSSSTGTRQMLYRADPFQIDLQLEAQPGGRCIVVTGQLLNFSHPEILGNNVPVMLSNLRGHVIQTVTNQFGEFRESIETSGDLELMFPGANDKPVVILLRDPFGHSGEEKPSKP
jgi:predicted anti-sigma-YlaC factor YlaD